MSFVLDVEGKLLKQQSALFAIYLGPGGRSVWGADLY